MELIFFLDLPLPHMINAQLVNSTTLHGYLKEGNGNPVHYSCLENPMDREAWWAVVHSVAKSWTGLKSLSTYMVTSA